MDERQNFIDTCDEIFLGRFERFKFPSVEVHDQKVSDSMRLLGRCLASVRRYVFDQQYSWLNGTPPMPPPLFNVAIHIPYPRQPDFRVLNPNELFMLCVDDQNKHNIPPRPIPELSVYLSVANMAPDSHLMRFLLRQTEIQIINNDDLHAALHLCCSGFPGQFLLPIEELGSFLSGELGRQLTNYRVIPTEASHGSSEFNAMDRRQDFIDTCDQIFLARFERLKFPSVEVLDQEVSDSMDQLARCLAIVRRCFIDEQYSWLNGIRYRAPEHSVDLSLESLKVYSDLMWPLLEQAEIQVLNSDHLYAAIHLVRSGYSGELILPSPSKKLRSFLRREAGLKLTKYCIIPTGRGSGKAAKGLRIGVRVRDSAVFFKAGRYN